MVIEVRFGDILLTIRKKKNLSQEQLAQKIGVTRQTVSNWELNTTIPNIYDLKKISEALDISCDKLLNNKSKKIDNKEEKIKTSKLFVITLRVLGILLIINIIIIGIIYVIYRLNYEKNNIVGSYTIECKYKENSLRYNINYNKNNKIVKTTIEGNIIDDYNSIKWFKDLDEYVFSNDINNPIKLKNYIINEYKNNNGKCE